MSGSAVKLIDIARALGVSTATVSLALRNHPRISEKMRNKIQMKAASLGYLPNLAAQTLAQRGDSGGSNMFMGTIGLVMSSAYARVRADNSQCEVWDTNLRSCCELAGYGLDRFTVGPTVREQKALSRVLAARGIRGLVFYSNNEGFKDWALDWDRFACVTYCSSVHEHFLHNVMSTSYQDVYDAVIKVKEMGYRRPGYFVPHEGFDYWSAGFLSGIHEMALKFRTPILNHGTAISANDPDNDFLKWFRKYKPDVIIANYTNRLPRLLEGIGLRVPDDVGYLCLDVWPPFLHLSGLLQLRESTHQVIVDLLRGMIQRNQYGKPEQPLCIQIPSVWNAGATLRTQ
jgi:LacI family transcriptional regulator